MSKGFKTVNGTYIPSFVADKFEVARQLSQMNNAPVYIQPNGEITTVPSGKDMAFTYFFKLSPTKNKWWVQVNG